MSGANMVALYESGEELEELFSPGFMERYTNFKTFEEFRFSGAVFVDWSAGFIVGPREAFNCCVRGKTTFQSWEEMYQAARAFQNARCQNRALPEPG